jgi:hypothetical protein
VSGIGGSAGLGGRASGADADEFEPVADYLKIGLGRHVSFHIA